MSLFYPAVSWHTVVHIQNQHTAVGSDFALVSYTGFTTLLCYVHHFIGTIDKCRHPIWHRFCCSVLIILIWDPIVEGPHHEPRRDPIPSYIRFWWAVGNPQRADKNDNSKSSRRSPKFINLQVSSQCSQREQGSVKFDLNVKSFSDLPIDFIANLV